MKFQIEQKDLVSLLTAIKPASEGKADLPAYLCTQIVANEDTVVLNSFSIMLSMSATTSCPIESKGAVGVATKSFYDVARVSEGLLTIELKPDDNRLHIKGKGSHFQLNTIAGDNFPLHHNMDAVKWQVDEVCELLPKMKQVWFSAGKEEHRAPLQGVFIQAEPLTLPGESEPQKHMVSCDGHRLATVTHGFDLGRDMNIPAESIKKVAAVLKIDEPLHYATSESSLLLSQGNIFAEIRGLDGGFPAYNKIIPSEAYDELIVNLTDMRAAMKKIAPLYDSTTTAKMACKDGVMTLTSFSHDLGKAESTLEVQMAKEFEVGFNAKYIEQVLDHLEGDTVVLKVRGSDRPIEIREANYLHVIMPKRVGS